MQMFAKNSTNGRLVAGMCVVALLLAACGEDRRGDDGGFGGGYGGGMGGGIPIGGGGLGIGGIVVLGLIGWALGINPFYLI